MTASITTTGTQNDPVETAYVNGETTRNWVEGHNNAVSGATPKGDKLETTWVSAVGTKSCATIRQSGESDGEFKQRHIYEYTLEMVSNPPVA